MADAIRKANDAARRSMFPVTMRERTIPHAIVGKCGASEVLLRPLRPAPASSPAAARGPFWIWPACTCAGQSLGAGNQLNVVKPLLTARTIALPRRVRALRKTEA